MFTNNVLRITPDPAKSKSLIETANARMSFVKEHSLKESNVSFIFECLYASLIEKLHAHALIHGFKIMNHLCLGFYSKNIERNDELFLMFEECRIKRNELVYDGKRLKLETAMKVIVICEKLLKEIDKL